MTPDDERVMEHSFGYWLMWFLGIIVGVCFAISIALLTKACP